MDFTNRRKARRRRHKVPNAVKDGRRNVRRLIAAADKGDAGAMALVEKYGLTQEAAHGDNKAKGLWQEPSVFDGEEKKKGGATTCQ